LKNDSRAISRRRLLSLRFTNKKEIYEKDTFNKKDEV